MTSPGTLVNQLGHHQPLQAHHGSAARSAVPAPCRAAPLRKRLTMNHLVLSPALASEQ